MGGRSPYSCQHDASLIGKFLTDVVMKKWVMLNSNIWERSWRNFCSGSAWRASVIETPVLLSPHTVGHTWTGDWATGKNERFPHSIPQPGHPQPVAAGLCGFEKSKGLQKSI